MHWWVHDKTDSEVHTQWEWRCNVQGLCHPVT